MQNEAEPVKDTRKIKIIRQSVLMMILGLVVAIVFSNLNHPYHEKIEAIKSWEPTQAIIKNQDLFSLTLGSRSPTTYKCMKLFLVYSFNNKNHETQDAGALDGAQQMGVDCRDISHHDQTKAEAQLRKDYPIGSSISILFNPQNLDQVIVVSEIKRLKYLNDNGNSIIWFGFAIIVASLLNLIRLLRR